MIISRAFLIVWVLALCSYGCAAVVLAWRHQLSQWPWLFALCVDEALVGFTLLVVRNDYRHYFWLYWINAGVIALLRVGLVRDVLRAIPSHEHISQRLWNSLWAIALVAGTVTALLTAPMGATQPAEAALLLNRCVMFTWAIVVMICLYSIVLTGFGFSRTGIRVASGAIIRLLSGVGISLFLAGRSAADPMREPANLIDTAISGGVAVYWCFAMFDAVAQRRKFLEDLGLGPRTE